MASANLYSSTGEAKGTLDLPDQLFAQPIHEQALYEAVRCYRANQRLGTHATRTRAEVRASKSKLYRQKGTGRARAGTAASPTRVGGGRAHGPHPRDYGYKLPRRIKRLALASALSDRASHERVSIVEDPALETPRTRAMAELLAALPLEGRHTLFVLPGESEADTLFRSLRNLQGVRVLRSHELNAYSVLWADNLVFTQKALSGTEEVFGR
jgi:large subunit ribosomal protein L4